MNKHCRVIENYPPHCLSFYLSIRLCVYPSICLSVYPSIYLSSYPSLCLSVYPSICLSVHPSIRLSILYPSICPSVYQSTRSSIYPYICLSVCPSVYLCLIGMQSLRPKFPSFFKVYEKRPVFYICIIYRSMHLHLQTPLIQTGSFIHPNVRR